MSKSYVFLGPSLPLVQAKKMLDAVYLPPVSMGDICKLALQQDKPFAIGIIDGLFNSVPSVFHKEILFAITKGIHIFGGASMGALRAAELHQFGMVGVGNVFEAYKCGDLVDDDEVAISHTDAEGGYEALSDAMVNIRTLLHKAWEDAAITTKTRDKLMAYAKSKFYTERSIKDVIKQCPVLERPDLQNFWMYHKDKLDIKAVDACLLLQAMKEAEKKAEPPPPRQFSLELTWPLEGLILNSREKIE